MSQPSTEELATPLVILDIASASAYAISKMQEEGYQQVSITSAQWGFIDSTPIVKVECTYKPENDVDDYYQAKAHWDVWINEDGKLYGEW